MAKSTVAKKSKKPLSKHSRAARRATSPSINTDKSLKEAQPPTEREHIHGAHHGAGITKRKAKPKQMTRSQRARQEKSLVRAEAVMHQLDKRKEQSMNRGKTVKERSGAWEDVNSKAGDKARRRKATGNGDGDGGEDSEWEDIENIAMGDAQPSFERLATEADTTVEQDQSDVAAAEPAADDGPEVW